jgi:type I restriction enzyme S subunit
MSEISDFLEDYYAEAVEIERSQVIEYIEGLWERFSELNLNDTNFIERFTSGDINVFNQKFWELWLGCRFDELELNPTSEDFGPDLKIEINGRIIWVEAVCPTAGSGDNEIPRPDFAEGKGGIKIRTYNLPANEILLRWTTAVAAKRAVFERYLQEGIITNEDPCVIAINSCLLGSNGFEGISQYPVALEAVYGIGAQQIQINRQTLEEVGRNLAFRPEIKNVNDAEIDCSIFLDEGTNAHQISGLLASLQHPSGCVDGVQHRPLTLVNNPWATNPLPEGLNIAESSYCVQKLEEDEGYQVISP